jgi:mRNA-degrading endonuclease RelE of RelBE toxin-antitoxin system
VSELREPFDLPAATEAVDSWLTKFREAFDTWKGHYPLSAAAAAEMSWLEVLRWYAALELSFTQLAEELEDQMDITDAQRALEDPSPSSSVQHVTMRPLAKERLDMLSSESREHLLQVHLDRLVAHPHPPDAEPLNGSEELYRVRAHDCRIIYRVQGEDVLILTVTPGHRLVVKHAS